MTLYINACVRKESRTARIAQAFLQTLGGTVEEVRLSDLDLQPLSEERLARRTRLIASGDFSDPMFDLAKQFAAAENIVIAAPFWDLSFPSILKVYIENIYVTGIVSRYGADGRPQGLCKAQTLHYVTTVGGPYVPDFSYGYISTLAKDFLGIPETRLIKADMLDIDGTDAENVVADVIRQISATTVS